MDVYLSGPMTGLPEHNFPAFEDAARRLRDAGYTVTSPHEKDLQDGFDPSTDGEDFDLRAALEWDVAAVLDSDAVVLLPGWETSSGVAIELIVAAAHVIPAIPLEHALQIAASAA